MCSLGLLDKEFALLFLGDFFSQSPGQSGSQFLGDLIERKRGLVGFVVGPDSLSGLEGLLNVFSSLEVHDGEDSGNCLFDDSDFGEFGGNSGSDFIDSQIGEFFSVFVEGELQIFDGFVSQSESSDFFRIH